MVKPPNEPLPLSSQPSRSPDHPLSQFFTPLNWVGYGLLALVLFDFIELLVPPSFMNPVWEFQTMGAIVERSALILIALVLAFLGDRHNLNKWERPALKGLSWLALFLGAAYLLLIPLGIANSVRIEQQTDQALATQLNQKQQVIQQVKAALSQVKTTAEMEQLIGSLTSAGVVPDIKDTRQLEQVRQKLGETIADGERKLVAQAQATQSEQHLKLLKKSLKWNLGALLSGLLLIRVWQSTRWARQD
jgi:hypothetical protein